MTRKILFLIALAAIIVLFGACVLEYDFDRAPPWTSNGTAVLTGTRSGTGSAPGFFGRPVTVTVWLDGGAITRAAVDARHETPSYAREPVAATERNAPLLNSFDFLDSMSGATRTRNAIRDAGNAALVNAGAFLP